MNRVLRDTLTYSLAIVARAIAPTFARQISRLTLRMEANLPRLGSTWVVAFDDPTVRGNSRRNAIDATLQQYGRFVWGTGHIQGEPGDPFLYRGVIKRNVFYGTFYRKDSHILAGTGMFVVKIKADSRRMAGRCTWYDSLIDDVWSSEYGWNRKS